VEKAGLYRQNRNWQIFKDRFLSQPKSENENRDYCSFISILGSNFITSFLGIKNKAKIRIFYIFL